MQKENRMHKSTDGRNHSDAALRAFRKRAIEAAKEGMGRAAIAKALGFSRRWVYDVLKAAEKHGEQAAILGHKRGPKDETAGAMRLLTPQQERQLYRWIVDSDPRQMKFDWAVWTRRAIQDLIREKFGVEMAIRTVSAYMKRWNMTPQRPKKAALEQDPEAVKHWLEVEYPKIAQRAKDEGALILWQDETAIKQDTNWIRGYAPKGQTPVVRQIARCRYGAPVMISAISNQGKCFFLFQRKAVNAYHFIRFLHRLIRELGVSRKLFVICDNAKIHRARLVSAWVAKHSQEIELFFLPPYSPTLNPDEYLNRQIKTELRLKAATDHDGALQIARSMMEAWKDTPAEICKCFEHTDVRYARHSEAA